MTVPSTSHASGAVVEVFVFQGGRFLGSRCFSQQTIVVGSGADTTLRLRAPDVAERHAILRVEGDSLVLASNSDAGPVLVNNERISVRRIGTNDEVRIGPFRVKMTLLASATEENAGFGVDASSPRSGVAAPARVPVSMPAPSPMPAPGSVSASEGSEDSVTKMRPRASLRDQAADVPAALYPGGNFESEMPNQADHWDHAAVDQPAGHDGLWGQTASRSQAGSWQRAPSHQLSADSYDLGVPGAETARADDTAPQHTPPRDAHGAFDEPVDAWHHHERKAQAFDDDAYHEVATRASEQPYAAAEENFRDEDEDEDEDEEFVEPFSLLENVVRERFKSPTDCHPYRMVEVIRYQSGELMDLLSANPGKSIRLFPDNFRLVDVLDDGRARVYFRDSFSGSVVRDGKSMAIKALARPDMVFDRKRNTYAVELREGDYAQIVRPDAGYLARFVRPPKVPKPRFRVRFGWQNVQIVLGSAVFHFLLLVLLGFTAPEADLYVEPEAERFAQVAMQQPKLEKPEEKPPEPEPEPEPEPVEEQPAPRKKMKTVRKRPTPRTAAQIQKQQQKVQRKQVANVLTALQNVKRAGSPGRSSLKSLVTNVAAVRAPAGAGSNFKIAGVIGKIPGKGVRLAGGGRGSGKDTAVGRQLLASTKVANIKALAGTGQRVRGRARKAPTRSIRATGGTLSREAIQKVVSAHMHQIQACYERQLLTNRGLAGKIVFDWIITPNGSVGTARQVSSSLSNVAVSSCILRQIRTWRFPSPVGGSVNVRYPFVFRVQGF